MKFDPLPTWCIIAWNFDPINFKECAVSPFRLRGSLKTCTLLLLSAFILSASASWAEVRGMITRVQGDEVVVNLGLQKNMKPGTVLYVYNSQGAPQATVTVVQVDDYSSVVQITSMEPNARLGVGSNVNDTAYAATPPGAAPKPSPGATTGATTGGGTSTATVDPVKNFESSLKSHTQIYSFQGGKGGVIKIDATDIINIASTLGGMAGQGAYGIANPWLITTTAFDHYERYNTTARMNQKARSTLEIVYWDEALTGAYANYYVYKETYLDPAKKEEVRQSLLAQKGVSSSAVFQVRIRNKGPGTLQLAPFDWHLYLLDPEGNRVKAERYDEILDKAMNPGQEVQGYVYFPKRDPLGRPYVGTPVTVLVEDIFGERATIRWGTTEN